MIKENRIFLECFSGNKIDEMLPLIDLLAINGYEVFYSYSGDITQYANLLSYDNVTQLKQKDKNYYSILKSSKWVFLNTNLMTGTDFIKAEGQIVVQLWHGVPFKHIGNDVKYSVNNTSDLFTRTMNHELTQTDYFLMPNDFCRDVFKKGFNIPKNVKSLFAGYPRNDYMFTDYKSISRNELDIPNDKKIVLYAPTWNDKGIYGVYEFSQNINKIVETLSKTHFFIFSFHPGTKKVINFNPKSSNWIINRNSTLNNIDLFNLSDVLVTDFSSIMFDFSLTKKPVINFFTQDEYQEYINYRGAYFDMQSEQFNCAFNIEELISALNDLTNLDHKINKYSPHTGVSSAKILKDVGIELKNETIPIFTNKYKPFDYNFNDYIIKNPATFKIFFKIKKLLLKFRQMIIKV